MTTKLNKTEIKILRQANFCLASVRLDQPLKMKAAQRLAALGLVEIETQTNAYGYQWLHVYAAKKVEKV